MKIYDVNFLNNGKMETKQYNAYSFIQAVKYLLAEYPNAIVLKDNVSFQRWKKTRFGIEYVTHKYSYQNGKLNKYWGHYITGLSNALEDFKKRINE